MKTSRLFTAATSALLAGSASAAAVEMYGAVDTALTWQHKSYAAQANDILLISLGPLDGGRHDAEALKAQTLLAKQQHFIHRLLA